MIRGRSFPNLRAAALLAIVPVLSCLTGCARPVDGEPAAGHPPSVPGSAEALGELVVTQVPSGLPRLPDEQLSPPAGAKSVDDIAEYSDDPEHERGVLAGYGYRFGWERFWGTGSGPMTGVFVDQFDSRAGAEAYAEDLSRNDARRYDAVVHMNPPELPGGCRMLTADDPAEHKALGGPAALAWCGHGDFSVSVTSVADSLTAAEAEVRAVVAAQLDMLPP